MPLQNLWCPLLQSQLSIYRTPSDVQQYHLFGRYDTAFVSNFSLCSPGSVMHTVWSCTGRARYTQLNQETILARKKRWMDLTLRSLKFLGQAALAKYCLYGKQKVKKKNGKIIAAVFFLSFLPILLSPAHCSKHTHTHNTLECWTACMRDSCDGIATL